MSDRHSAQSVVCVCGGIGFPFGTASSKRIQLLGRGLVQQGMPFHVLHVGPSFCPDNTSKQGIYEGVSYEYLSPVVRFPVQKLFRVFAYLWGCLLLGLKIPSLSRKTLVYVYYQGSSIHLWTLLLCKLFRKPVMQEACEWWPDTPERTKLNDWIYKRIMFRWSCAALPISQHIEDRIEKHSDPGYSMFRVPVLVDPLEVNRQANRLVATHAVPRLLWCGSLYWFIDDARFMIEACAEFYKRRGQQVELVLCGPSSQDAEASLFQYAVSKGLPKEALIITGFLSEEDLWGHCLSASAFLMPMWNDSRSETRFPTKMGLYLAAGKPIITACVGEVAHYLEDGRSGLFYEVGSTESMSLRIEQVLCDPQVGKGIAAEATEVVLPRVDYRSVCGSLANWLKSLNCTD